MTTALQNPASLPVTMSAGQEIEGSWVSLTVTEKLQLFLLPAASVTSKVLTARSSPVARQFACEMLTPFFEKMFDGRMFFTDALVSMGAKIILCDPHRVVVSGPSQLVGATLESPDVRAGMALLIAALCARGSSTIYNVRQIDRGYEGIDAKLRALGASIQRLPA